MKFQVEDSAGHVLELEGDQEPTAEQLTGIFGEAFPAPGPKLSPVQELAKARLAHAKLAGEAVGQLPDKPLIALPEWSDTGQGGIIKRTAQQIYQPLKETAEFIESPKGLAVGAAAAAAPEVVGPAIAATAVSPAVQEELAMKQAFLSGQIPEALGHATKAAIAGSMLLGGLAPFRPKTVQKPPVIPLPKATEEAIKTVTAPEVESKPPAAAPREAPPTEAPTAATVSEGKPPGVAAPEEPPALIRQPTTESEMAQAPVTPEPSPAAPAEPTPAPSAKVKDYPDLQASKQAILQAESAASRISDAAKRRINTFAEHSTLTKTHKQSLSEVVGQDAQAAYEFAKEQADRDWDDLKFKRGYARIAKYIKEQWPVSDKPVEPTAQAAAKVESQVKEVARTEGQRPAKEVKNELVDRLQRAIDVAPSESEVSAKSYTTVQGKTVTSADRAETVTIDIPGDGVFTIRNTKEALEKILKRAKKISTSSTEPKVQIPKGGVQSSEKALGEMQRAKEAELGKNVKINQENARASLYDAINKSEDEGIVGTSKPEEDPQVDDGTLWREWRIRKATPEERTEHWKGTKAEIRWVGERRVVKFSKEKGRTENEWLFDDSGKTRADVIRGMEANMPKDATLQDPGLKNWRDLEKMEGGYSFLREGKTEPPAQDPGIQEPAAAFSESVKDIPTKSAIAAKLGEQAGQSQNLGITAIPTIGGTGLSKLGNALKAVTSEIRDIPKFTPFKQTINRWFGENQKTSMEVQRLMKDIESRVPTEARREAITNYLQADGDVAKLDAWAKGSKNIKRKRAYEAAKNLTPDELKVAQAIRNLYDDYLVKAQSYDLVDQGVQDYVTQVWKQPLLGRSQFAQFASRLAANFRFGQKRTFENFFEGEQAGYKPVTKDISRLVGLYVSEMGKTIATRDLIKDLAGKKADDGRPLAAPAGSGSVVLDKNAQPTLFVRQFGQPENMRDYSRWTHPALQGWKWVTKDPISGADVLFKGDLQLHPDIAQHVKNVLSRSEIKKWYDTPATALGVLPKAMVKAVDQWGSVTKQVMLGFFAPFHHVQEATHAIGHRVNPLFNLPKLDHTDPLTQRAMDHGLALAGDNAAMENFREGVGAHHVFEKIPVIGNWANAWSDFLFHEYIPRLKLKTYNDILERNKARYGQTASIDDIEYLSAQQTNAAYGHLNYADIGRNPTIQHLARIFALAPDFLEARTRFAGQALKGLVGMQGREQLLALATLAGTFYVGARILNKLGDGDYHWDEPFGFVHNGRIYTMRSVPEDMWRAFKDSRKFIYNRLSPVVGRGTVEMLTGKNYRGEKTTALETMQDLLVSWMPITLRSLPGFEKLSPSQQNRAVGHLESFLGAMGLQISRYSPINKTYQRAKDFMRAHGEKEDRGTYPVSKYQQLRYALEDADVERAAAEINRLKATEKLSTGKLHNGFKESLFHPWTKTKQMDAQFRASLSHDDRMLFDEAEQQRRRVWTRFNQALAQSQKP